MKSRIMLCRSSPFSLFNKNDLPDPHLAYNPTVSGNDKFGSHMISAMTLL